MSLQRAQQVHGMAVIELQSDLRPASLWAYLMIWTLVSTIRPALLFFARYSRSVPLSVQTFPLPALLPFPALTPLRLSFRSNAPDGISNRKTSMTILGMQSAVLLSSRASYGLILNVPINEKLCQTSSKETPQVSRQPSLKYK